MTEFIIPLLGFGLQALMDACWIRIEEAELCGEAEDVVEVRCKFEVHWRCLQRNRCGVGCKRTEELLELCVTEGDLRRRCHDVVVWPVERDGVLVASLQVGVSTDSC